MMDVPREGFAFNKTETGGSRYIVGASIYDNPYLTLEGVAEFESSLSLDERECRLHGLPMAMAGLIYKEFIYAYTYYVPAGWEESLPMEAHHQNLVDGRLTPLKQFCSSPPIPSVR
jgi:hypothetical protein